MLPLAPLIFADPMLSLDDAKRIVSKNMFGVETPDFFDASAIAGMNISPFTCGVSMAVQWNGLKDSMPAPRGYLEKLLMKWRTEEGGAAFRDWQNKLEKSEKEIQEAISLLTSFAFKAEKGFDTLEYWIDALTMQLWMIRIGKMIFEGKVTSETVGLLKKLKKEVRPMISRRETPRSARKNTDLLFDWLIEYCRKITRNVVGKC
jgi:hypothetical protein